MHRVKIWTVRSSASVEPQRVSGNYGVRSHCGFLLEERPELTIDHILALPQTKFACQDFDLEILTVAEKNGNLKVEMMFRQHVPTPNENWSFGLEERLVVLDENGVRMRPVNIRSREYAGAKSMTQCFNAPVGKKVSKPSKLLFNEWITETREIEFTWKNIPLP